MVMNDGRDDETERRRIQDYIIRLEQVREEAERLAAEHERLKHYQALFVEHVPIGFFSFDRQGTILEVNRKLLDILGSPSVEFTRSINVLTFPPLVKAGLSEVFQQCLEKGEVISTELPYTSVWGKPAYLREFLIPVRDSDGRVTGCLAAVEDISKEKKAEDELRESREEYRRLYEESKRAQELYESLLNASPDAVVVCGLDGKTRYVNESFARLFGWTLEEIEGQPIPFVDHSDETTAGRTVRFLLRQGPGLRGYETTAITRSGETLDVSLGASHYHDHEGKPAGILFVLADITARKKAEAELNKAQAMLTAAVEQTPAGILIADAPDAKIRLANSAALGIRGRSSGPLTEIPYELHPHNWQTYRPDGTPFPAEELPLTKAVLFGHVSKNVEAIVRRSDGEERWILANAAPVRDSAGEIVAGVAVFPDITERKKLEDQLRQAAKMEAIGRLAGGVAHDFNNLLTAMIGYSNILMQQLPRGTPQHDKLVQIHRAAERAAALTQQLLAFSRKQVLDVKVLNLNAVIDDLQQMLRRIIGEDVTLSAVFDMDLGCIRADPSQVEQILMNLVVNARDAMPQGGRLTIETANVFLDREYARSVAEVAPGPYIMLAVTDTGHGMDPETTCRVFDPFFTTKEKGVGTGLGLSTVYGIVKQHGGHISVYTETGIGTTFKVYFPSVEGDADRIRKPAWPHEKLQGTETVLVVEDEDLVRDLAADMLQMLGYKTLQAGDGEQAMKIATDYREEIHLLVTDVVLPQIDGRTLYDRLSKVRPDMKVLYVSGYTENAIVHHGVLDPGVHFLPKPFTVDGLAAKVRELLD